MRSVSCIVGLSLLIVGACGDASRLSKLDDASPVEALASARGVTHLAALRRRFGAALPAGAIERFEHTVDGRLVAVAPVATRRARVELPPYADGPVIVRDGYSGMSAQFELIGARHQAVEIASGYAVYRDGLGAGTDVLHRPHAIGIEDYVVFRERPTEERLTYRVDVSDAAGLRLVNNVLEFLDDAGIPRLRVAPPYVTDAVGRHEASLDVAGCDVDNQAAPPWRRAPEPPCGEGPCTCEVSLRWSGTTYPLLVDPSWTTTGELIASRVEHSATALLDGDVLVVGGQSENGSYPASCEVFHPDTGVWTTGPVLNQVRRAHTATLLASGNVLVVGGRADSVEADVVLASAELLIDDVWIEIDELSPRQYHSATRVGAEVIVAGGLDQVELSSPPLSTALVFTEAMGFTTAPSLKDPRAMHSGTAIGGNVLVAGGRAGDQILASAERYEPNGWVPAPSMGQARYAHTATLHDGGVLVVGGFSLPTGGLLASVERYGTAWAVAPSLTEPRARHTATLLPDGRLLVAGGLGDAGVLASAALFSGEWSAVHAMETAREQHAAAAVATGVVVAGGQSTEVLSSAELFALASGGDDCRSDAECASGVCVGDVCCDQPCDGACEACTAAGKADGGPDGVCGPAAGNPCSPLTCAENGGCLESCDAHEDCASGHHCDEGACLPGPTCDGEHLLIDADGAVQDCFPFNCNSDGACLEDCTSSADCATGTSCDVSGQCAKFTPTIVDPPSCTQSHRPGGGPLRAHRWVLWGLVLGAALLLRRRP